MDRVTIKLENLFARLKTLRELRPEGPPHAVGDSVSSLGLCRTCNSPIYWGVMRRWPHPFDLDGASHFSTCQQAEAWRQHQKQEPERPRELHVGDVYKMLRDWPALGVVAGDRGIAVEVYQIGDSPGQTLLFANGEHDGFSRQELDDYCRHLGPCGLLYAFKNAMGLAFDFKAGAFKRAFAEAAALPEVRP